MNRIRNPVDKKGKDVFKEVISWMMWIAGAALVAILLNSFVFINANVSSGSMENTLMVNDQVLGLRFIYLFKDPQRLDIIVFKNPTAEDGNPYVKRVIGLPGETIHIVDGQIFIDDAAEPLDEPYLRDAVWGYGMDATYEVPENCYFALGDNRNNSMDSRDWGFVDASDIYGKIYIDLFPNTKWLLN